MGKQEVIYPALNSCRTRVDDPIMQNRIILYKYILVYMHINLKCLHII